MTGLVKMMQKSFAECWVYQGKLLPMTHLAIKCTLFSTVFKLAECYSRSIWSVWERQWSDLDRWVELHGNGN